MTSIKRKQKAAMKIGNVTTESNLIFAPIAGFSEAGARALACKFGADFAVTEMVSAKGLVYGNKNTAELLHTTDAEKTKCVQIFGSDPEFMFKASADPLLEKFDIIDINMGCPVRKIFSNGDGSALMKDPKLIGEIVSAVKEGGKKPVTVKLRAGIEMGKPLCVQCALEAERAGADAVTLHPRYREQMYAGQADHSLTKQLKEILTIPVIANGDIVSLESYQKIKEMTGADGFMLARGALGNPWLFAQIKGLDVQIDVINTIIEHIDILKSYLSERVVVNAMKTQLCYYARNQKGAKDIRKATSMMATYDDLFGVIELFSFV